MSYNTDFYKEVYKEIGNSASIISFLMGEPSVPAFLSVLGLSAFNASINSNTERLNSNTERFKEDSWSNDSWGDFIQRERLLYYRFKDLKIEKALSIESFSIYHPSLKSDFSSFGDLNTSVGEIYIGKFHSRGEFELASGKLIKYSDCSARSATIETSFYVKSSDGKTLFPVNCKTSFAVLYSQTHKTLN